MDILQTYNFITAVNGETICFLAYIATAIINLVFGGNQFIIFLICEIMSLQSSSRGAKIFLSSISPHQLSLLLLNFRGHVHPNIFASFIDSINFGMGLTVLIVIIMVELLFFNISLISFPLYLLRWSCS